ncbi:MAG TPA: hypothetical protein VNI57_08085, partial [Candidatus Saccharimonadales bacterium]|nr:hypothetical protein [Candidatus Saccharimonadales bacterium]
LHAEGGRFVDMTEAAGLGGPGPGFLHLAAADFDRDGREDLFAAGLATSRLMINQGIDPTTGAMTFADRAEAAGLAGGGRIASLAVQLTPEECDFSVQLLTASADARTGALVHVFPDDSAGHTIRMSRGAREAEAAFDGACVRGSDGPDRILGNERTSILYGGAGDDTLIARGGVTILDGGPGKDRFVATGYTIIRLPAADIEPGETIVCDPTRSVMIESPLSRTELERAGVVFEGCFHDTYCPDPSGPTVLAGTPRITGAAPGDPQAEAFECHGSTSRAAFTAINRDPFLDLAKSVNRRNLVAYDGPGVGTCDPAKIGDCARYGLESCLATDTGYQCFPNLQQWCDDPFFARNVATETLGDLIATGKRFILPMVIWLPRSDAISPGGSCNKGDNRTVSDWHASIAQSMNSLRSRYGQWGVDVDYRIRIFTVPSGSDFVDPKDPGCTDIVYSDEDPDYDPSRHNTVEDLVNAYPARYSDGEMNVYLTDQGDPHGESYSFPWQKANTSVYRKFILIHGGFGAIVHEMSHQLGLAHPWDNNLARANGSDTAESRDSWLYRPFPDQPTGGLNLCVSNADCDGADAGPGLCVTAPGAASGYCYNLKINCATKGDRVCDTPWDTLPCFQVGDKLGEICLTDDDCLVDGGFVGKSYETTCFFGRCGPRHCNGPSGCLSGLCVDGVCANFPRVKSQSCCDLHDDTVVSKEHNTCVEWASDTKGTQVLSPGVGNSTTWPLARNAMTYHHPGGRVPITYTKGQRDRVICRLHYSEEYGQILKKPRPDGEPCSTRPGGTTLTYGGPNEDRDVPHGACASGVCSVNRTLIGPQAVCASATCSDGITGSKEADADCGASCRIQFGQICDYNPLAGVEEGCQTSSDCVSGVCEAGRCMPTCSDGKRNGTELGIDLGGTGSVPSCGGRPLGATCRFPDDCSQPAFCAGVGECVTSADCPINIPFGTACTQDYQCHGGVCRSAAKSFCATQACAVGYECRSGVCNTIQGKCECSDQDDCLPSDSCNITSGVCTNECVDGRCLGQCTPIRTGP